MRLQSLHDMLDEPSGEPAGGIRRSKLNCHSVQTYRIGSPYLYDAFLRGYLSSGEARY